MSLPGGIGGSLSFVGESTYNTEATVTRSMEFKSEGIEVETGQADSQQIRAGQRILASDRRKTFQKGIGGPIAVDLLNKGIGLFLQAAFGTDTVSGAGAAKTHTVVIDANAQKGKSLTLQINRPSEDGTDRVWTFKGSKFVGTRFMCELGGNLGAEFDVDCGGYDLDTTLVTPAYPATAEHFIFAEGAVTFDGSTMYASKWDLAYNPNLNTGRRYIGNSKREPIANGYGSLGGNLTGLYADLAHHNKEVAGTIAALSVVFTLATVIPTTATPFSLTFTLPAVQLLKAAPKIAGPEEIVLDIPYRVLDNRSDPPISIVLVTSDTAA